MDTYATWGQSTFLWTFKIQVQNTKQIYPMENGELHYIIGFFSIFDFTKIIIRIINYSFLFLNLK